jgi:RHS repeat-associated protein
LTDYNLTLVAVVDLDPWGGETDKSWGQGKQPHKYTTYERDGNGNDQAMNRQYHSYWQRFDQPDPFDGSYDASDPQSLNRYAYVGNDPVNRTDPSGLDWDDDAFAELDAAFNNLPDRRGGGGGGGGGGGFSFSSNSIALSPEERLYEQRVNNAWGGYGFLTSAQVNSALAESFPIHYGYNADGSLWTYFSISGGTTTGSLDWHERGPLGPLGDISRGIASSVTFGITERIHESRGEPRPDTTASNIGEGAGNVLSMALPGGGLRGVAGVLRVTFKHGVLHLVGRGLAQRTVERAIRSEVRAVAGSASTTGSFWGRVSVGGRTVEYRAFTLPNGTINVGTYYIPPGF